MINQEYKGAEEEASLLKVKEKDAKYPAKIPGSDERVTWRNLPHKQQLLLLALCRLSNPLTNGCLIPYIYYLVKSIASTPNDPSSEHLIPQYTGFLIAAFPLGQMATSMLWGRLSDSYGRKPIIIFGLAVSVVSNIAFGFSRTIAALMFWRVLAGMVNGNLGVMRTMTAEIVKERKYQTRAFLVQPLMFNSGRVAALAIGGCLADPVKNIQWLFGPKGILNVAGNFEGVAWMLKYPYALPALFNGITLGIVLLFAFLGLKESLPAKEDRFDPGLLIGKYLTRFLKIHILRKYSTFYTPVQIEDPDVVIDDAPIPSNCLRPIPSSQPHSPRPTFRKMWTRHLLITLFSFFLLPLHNSTFTHLFPVYLCMPTFPNPHPSLFHFAGGLGLASPSVGLYLAAFGVCGILLQLFIFPHVQQRIGTLGCLRLANCVFPVVYLFAPYLSLLAERRFAKWPAMGGVLFMQVMARTTAIPSSVVLLNEAAPAKNVLGTVHGAGNMVNAMASACGPIIGGILLALGRKVGVVGVVWWGWLFLVSVMAGVWSWGVMGMREDGEEEVQETGREKGKEEGC
ncbi:MFS general substrate transporter [Delitschia confertaspora ATCC 74209]|uniref:MFS general substrate transporter n=1 Tax=Delitschia confertaspora ATCC 74209 TaxID=1513339 RepID=A0A9P4JL98_9PLEO|nr:MFS general substrate transporter [Delitschia confertaspora ATCC 74209]